MSDFMEFQSTPPCGGDLFLFLSQDRMDISIHAPLRGRPICCWLKYRPADFNPRPLAGATARKGVPEIIRLFQSTPPCGGDQAERSTFNEDKISIHAPLRGRPFFSPSSILPSDFNPRPLAGATSLSMVWLPFTLISIHAPLRGRRGEMRNNNYTDEFQSTPPCGGDWHPGIRRRAPYHFNPRPLAGATRCTGQGLSRDAISIHAPLRGRHRVCEKNPAHLEISIHAPLRGRQVASIQCRQGVGISIHAPLRGRHETDASTGHSSHFNPRPLAGATGIPGYFVFLSRISIHAPLRGRRMSTGNTQQSGLFQSTPPCGGDIL